MPPSPLCGSEEPREGRADAVRPTSGGASLSIERAVVAGPVAVGDSGGDIRSMGANSSWEGVVLYAYVAAERYFTLEVDCLGVGRAAPAVEDSALFVACGRLA